MDIPTYEGQPLSWIVKLTDPDSPITAWMWGYARRNLRGNPDTIDRLIADGYVQVPRESGGHLMAQLLSQCADGYIIDANTLWVRAEHLEWAKKYPVTLGFTLEDAPEPVVNEDRIAMLQFLPPALMGQVGTVDDPEVKPQCSYFIQHLPWVAQVLYGKIGKALIELAYPAEWATHTDASSYCASELDYQRIMVELRSSSLASRGKKRQEIKNAIEKLEQVHREVVLLRQSWLKPDWLVRWGEIRAMAQQLSAEYWKFHTALKEKDQATKQQQETKHNTQIPDVKTSQKTMLPSNNAFRAIEQSFGNAVRQPSLWNSETSNEQTLATPNGALLRVKGDQPFENKALYQYITTMMGPEGLKHMLILLDTHYADTGGETRLIDTRIAVRQLLMRMGYTETQADDINERKKLVHTILYLARTWVTSSEVKYEEVKKGRGRKGKRSVDWSPLLVIEQMKSSEDGGLDVPDEVVFHLGKDFYESLFGEEAQFFTLPTAQVLSYHAQREQQELCLSFYLSNMVIISKPYFPVSFRELVFKSALMSIETIEHDEHRTLKAENVIYALERLEKDGLVLRSAHEQVDLVLAIELFRNGAKTKEKLAPATLERIERYYQHAKAYSPDEMRRKRRIALQELLASKETTPVVTFYPGPLLVEQAQKLQERRQKAIDRSENAQVARVVRRASKIVNSTLQPQVAGEK